MGGRRGATRPLQARDDLLAVGGRFTAGPSAAYLSLDLCCDVRYWSIRSAETAGSFGGLAKCADADPLIWIPAGARPSLEPTPPNSG